MGFFLRVVNLRAELLCGECAGRPVGEASKTSANGTNGPA